MDRFAAHKQQQNVNRSEASPRGGNNTSQVHMILQAGEVEGRGGEGGITATVSVIYDQIHPLNPNSPLCFLFFFSFCLSGSIFAP